MGKAFDGIASSLGSAVGTFQRAMSLARIGRKPGFFSGVVEEARYDRGTGYEEAAQKRAIVCSHVFSAISLIAREVSAAQFQVVEYEGVDSKPIQIPNHPIEALLRVPNPHMGGVFLWEYTTWWLQLDGNAYWFLGTDALGRLQEIWPLPASDIEIVPGDETQLIEAYEYTVQGRAWPIPAENIVHFSLPNPFDIFRGMSRLRAGMLAVDTDLAMSRWNARFFGRDNVMPSAIINLSTGDPNQPLARSDVDALKEDLREGYSALQRRTAVTGAYSMDVELLGWNPKDLDFIQGREATGTEIYKLFGIPGGLFDKDATYANSENANRVFNNKTLWPLLRLMSEQLTGQLIVPLLGKDYAAAFEDVRTTSREVELQEIGAAGPYLLIDEVREDWWGKKPLPDDRGQWTAQEAQAREQAQAEEAFAIEGEYAEEPEEEAPRQLPSTTDTEALDDMRRWKRKVLNAVKRGRSVPISFSSESIPEGIVDQLKTELYALRYEQKEGKQAGDDLVESIKLVFSASMEKLQETKIASSSPIVADIERWKARAIETMGRDGRALLLYHTVTIPPNITGFIRQELKLGPQTEEAVRSVFAEALDFYFPFRSRG